MRFAHRVKSVSSRDNVLKQFTIMSWKDNSQCSEWLLPLDLPNTDFNQHLMCSQQYFHYDSKRDKDGHNEWKPYRINSVGSYWGWFPVMQCRETSRGGRWGTDSSDSPSQDRCFPTFNTYWCQSQRLNTNGFRKTDWWQSTDDYWIALFSFEDYSPATMEDNDCVWSGSCKRWLDASECKLTSRGARSRRVDW